MCVCLCVQRLVFALGAIISPELCMTPWLLASQPDLVWRLSV